MPNDTEIDLTEANTTSTPSSLTERSILLIETHRQTHRTYDRQTRPAPLEPEKFLKNFAQTPSVIQQ